MSASKTAARVFRVNARLDAATYQQLNALEAHTKLSTTDVVREALRRMHAEIAATSGRARSALDEIVGKHTGAAADLSQQSKAVLADAWRIKHER